MKDSKKVLELIGIAQEEGICFSINTDVPLTADECNEIIKTYMSAFARKCEIGKEEMKKIEKMKQSSFEIIKTDKLN